VLSGLGFRKEDWTRRPKNFQVAGRCASPWSNSYCNKPNLLLLTSPTNHLDLEARKLAGGIPEQLSLRLVLISHDRYFLDVTINKIVENLEQAGSFYHGNYEKYLDAKTQRLEQLESAYRNQRERIEQLEVFINRFPLPSHQGQTVQSRIKELEKIERIECLEERDHQLFFSPAQARRAHRG